MPRGLRHAARSIPFFSSMTNDPLALSAMMFANAHERDIGSDRFVSPSIAPGALIESQGRLVVNKKSRSLVVHQEILDSDRPITSVTVTPHRT
jgi:hypothetical protein